MSMDIAANPGTPITYAHPKAGRTDDQELAKKHLTLGQTYRVASTDVGAWRTDVYLEEVPHVAFNSVLFD